MVLTVVVLPMFGTLENAAILNIARAQESSHGRQARL